MLKKSAGVHGPWRVRHARRARSEVRSSGFEVPKTSNLGRLAFPVSLAWRLRDVATSCQE